MITSQNISQKTVPKHAQFGPRCFDVLCFPKDPYINVFFSHFFDLFFLLTDAAIQAYFLENDLRQSFMCGIRQNCAVIFQCRY